MSHLQNDPQNYSRNCDLAKKAPRRGAVDFTGTGRVKSDYWHKGMPSEVVSRNHAQFPGMHFSPADGVGTGVAMTACEYAEGMAIPGQSIFDSLPAELQHVKSGVLIITWPGYQHVRWKHDITFVHPNGTPFANAHMAYQIARIWRSFYQKHHTDFNGTGVRLGTNNVSYNHLRLHQIYTNDGRHWQAEVSYIKS